MRSLSSISVPVEEVTEKRYQRIEGLISLTRAMKQAPSGSQSLTQVSDTVNGDVHKCLIAQPRGMTYMPAACDQEMLCWPSWALCNMNAAPQADYEENIQVVHKDAQKIPPNAFLYIQRPPC